MENYENVSGHTVNGAQAGGATCEATCVQPAGDGNAEAYSAKLEQNNDRARPPAKVPHIRTGGPPPYIPLASVDAAKIQAL